MLSEAGAALAAFNCSNIDDVSDRKLEVETILESEGLWQKEMRSIREILLGCGLTEEVKWRQPCYSHNGANVALIGGFKDYCSVSFFKGALLDDPENLLVAPGENTQSARLIKVTDVEEVEELRSSIVNFVEQAVENEESGVTVEFKKTEDYSVPVELQEKLDAESAFRSAFEALTPGRQRGYLLHFGGAKQSKTRASRIDKCVDRIMDGKGLRDCICGHSKRLPSCDGSHKKFE